jgi:hypothetical protein
VTCPRIGRALAVSLMLVSSGCGGGPTDEEQVRDVLAEFGRATAAKDYEALCDRILAPALIEDVKRIGLPCEIALQNALGDVDAPRLTVGRVRISGDKASAEVRSSAKGQEPSSDIVELVKDDDDWRIASLAGASPPAPNSRPQP